VRAPIAAARVSCPRALAAMVRLRLPGVGPGARNASRCGRDLPRRCDQRSDHAEQPARCPNRPPARARCPADCSRARVRVSGGQALGVNRPRACRDEGRPPRSAPVLGLQRAASLQGGTTPGGRGSAARCSPSSPREKKKPNGLTAADRPLCGGSYVPTIRPRTRRDAGAGPRTFGTASGLVTSDLPTADTTRPAVRRAAGREGFGCGAG
jgi:hypothetical protein